MRTMDNSCDKRDKSLYKRLSDYITQSFTYDSVVNLMCIWDIYSASVRGNSEESICRDAILI